MTNYLLRVSLPILLLLISEGSASARIISSVFEFNANDDTVLTTVTQTVVANFSGGQSVSFDLDLTLSALGGGSVVDTSRGNGLSVTAGDGLNIGDEIGFSIGISNINTDVDNDGNRINISAPRFRSLSPAFSFGSGSAGTVVTPAFTAGSSDWQDSNTGPADFLGHFTTSRFYSSAAGNFNVSAGFDLPLTNAANGGSSTVPITSFSHRTTASPTLGYTLNQVVVQVQSTPEPSSLLLGLLPVAALGLHRRSRERIRQLLSQKVEA